MLLSVEVLHFFITVLPFEVLITIQKPLLNTLAIPASKFISVANLGPFETSMMEFSCENS